MSGYKEAMEAAGATVHEYFESGSYQGTWLAKVSYGGDTGWVEGAYGSCSGCDSFESEFGYGMNHEHPDGKYYSPNYDGPVAGCAKCGEYQEKLIKFGEGYLRSIIPHEQMLTVYRNKCAEEYAWEDDKEILKYLEGCK